MILKNLDLKPIFAKNWQYKFFCIFKNIIIFSYICQISALHINLKKKTKIDPPYCTGYDGIVNFRPMCRDRESLSSHGSPASGEPSYALCDRTQLGGLHFRKKIVRKFHINIFFLKIRLFRNFAKHAKKNVDISSFKEKKYIQIQDIRYGNPKKISFPWNYVYFLA